MTRPPSLLAEWVEADQSWSCMVQKCEGGAEPIGSTLKRAKQCPTCGLTQRSDNCIAFTCPDCTHFVSECANGHRWTTTIALGWFQVEQSQQFRRRKS